MAKHTLILAGLFACTPLAAQVFYTDSDVRERNFSVAPFVQANTVFRRTGAEVVGQQQPVGCQPQSPVFAAFATCAAAMFRSNCTLENFRGSLKNFRLGLDAAQSNFAYRQGADLDNMVRTQSNYLMLRGRLGVKTEISDETTLEVWVPIAYRRLQSVQRDGSSDGVASTITSAGIELGPSIKLNENWSWFGLIGLDDALTEFEVNPGNAYREYHLWLTMSTGIRFVL